MFTIVRWIQKSQYCVRKRISKQRALMLAKGSFCLHWFSALIFIHQRRAVLLWTTANSPTASPETSGTPRFSSSSRSRTSERTREHYTHWQHSQINWVAGDLVIKTSLNSSISSQPLLAVIQQLYISIYMYIKHTNRLFTYVFMSNRMFTSLIYMILPFGHI